MISNDVWNKYHEWFFEICLRTGIHCGSGENLLKYPFFIESNMSDFTLFLMSSNKLSLPTVFYTLQRNKCIIRELKHQRRRQLRKRSLKSEFALLQTLSRLFYLVQFVKCGRIFLKLNSKWILNSTEVE